MTLVRKPPGPPAFSVVQQTNDLLAAQGGRQWAVCHGGALDPFAEGLMLVLVGPATKLFSSLHAAPKTYLATVRWGLETDNGDLLGAEVARGDASKLTVVQLEQSLPPMLGLTLNSCDPAPVVSTTTTFVAGDGPALVTVTV